MPKVFTTTPGEVLRIGSFGTASNDVPAIVPDEVADQLEREMKGEPATKAVRADEAKGIPASPARPGRPAHSRFRIERDQKPKAASSADKE